MLSVLAKANLARELQMGSMIAMITGDQYNRDRHNHLDYLQTTQKKTYKTAELFCLIKNTEQAEEVATGFFSVIWRGLSRLTHITVGFQIAKDVGHCKIRRTPTLGKQ